jgi:hypothetical protein
MGYEDQQALRVVIEQADRYKAEMLRLRRAITNHYRQIHEHNWSVDDELWAEVGLIADPAVVG